MTTTKNTMYISTNSYVWLKRMAMDIHTKDPEPLGEAHYTGNVVVNLLGLTVTTRLTQWVRFPPTPGIPGGDLFPDAGLTTLAMKYLLCYKDRS